MSREKDVFNLSGPKHLGSIDWDSFDQKRAVVASLVKGVSAMARDSHRDGSRDLAPPWWESFGFVLHEPLIDEHDSSIYGAIYKFRSRDTSKKNSPEYVVAFRGTVIEWESVRRDAMHNIMCMVQNLHKCFRFKHASRRVKSLVETAGASNVWLAGHSLGSAIAMLVGKDMVGSGYILQSYLFNPPYISLPIERIKNHKVSRVIRGASSVLKAGVAVGVKVITEQPLEDAHFAALSPWVPHIFVNQDDFICSGYIGYFDNRRNMEAIGAGEIARIASHNSLGSLLFGAVGSDYKPIDILPSAHLTVNRSRCLKPHSIKQWWDSNAQCEHSTHRL